MWYLEIEDGQIVVVVCLYMVNLHTLVQKIHVIVSQQLSHHKKKNKAVLYLVENREFGDWKEAVST